jgi:hypothetical protein
MTFLELRGVIYWDASSYIKNKTPWAESASELYLPSYRRLSAKWLPTFVDRGYHVVSVTDPYGRILGFLDRSRYFFFQVPAQLYSRGWVDPVPDPLLFFSGSAGNRTRAFRICSQELWPDISLYTFRSYQLFSTSASKCNPKSSYKKYAVRRTLVSGWFLALLFNPQHGNKMFSRNVCSFTRLHCVTSQKAVLIEISAQRI